MRYIGGIDPGLSGALAVLDFQTHRLHVWDTPTYKVKVGDKVRRRCDELSFADALDTYEIDMCMIEKVQSTPNDGHVGAFTFGKVTGIAIGLCVGMGIEYEEVTPAKWKMSMQVPRDKEAARFRASNFFPQCAGLWRRQMDDGRAEAAIIALYASIAKGLAPEAAFSPGLLNGVPFKTSKKKPNGS